jgi:serine/threonine protein kinase
MPKESVGNAESVPNEREQRPPVSAGDTTELDTFARTQLAEQFQIEEVLSEKAHTIVYAAREPELGRRVALRVIQIRAEDVAFEAAVRRAITSAASLSHPHIVPLYRSGTERDLVWYTMRFVEGKSLAEWVRDQGPLEVRTCLAIVEQVASAVYYAHRRGVSHGDLRLERVLFADREWAFVSEFETGRLLRALQEPNDAPAGTRAARVYRSSQQRPRPADDQAALAVAICECLTGTRQTLSGDVTPCERLPAVLTDARTDVPVHVVGAIRRALSDRASDRFVSVLDFVAALSSDAQLVRHATPPSATPYDVAPHVLFVDHPRSALRRRRWLAAGGVCAALGAIAIVSLVRDGGNAPLPSEVTSPMVARVSPGAVTVPEVAPASQTPDSITTRVDTAIAEPRPPRTSTAQPARERPRRPPPNERPRRPRPLASPRATRTPPPSTVQEPGRLFVSSRPWGSLYVDGTLVGNTPRANLAISAGTHRIRIVRNGFLPFERQVSVSAGDRVRLVDIVLQAAPR